jgi:hypothetical protein
VAESLGLPQPPRISLEEAESRVPQTVMSFMRESRRVSNRRLQRELRVKVRYPTVAEGLAEAARLRLAPVAQHPFPGRAVCGIIRPPVTEICAHGLDATGSDQRS